jgi:alpha-beta hydrolase superfamily lysophospholipase
VPLDQLQQAVQGLHGLLGTFQAVTASGNDQYLAQFDGGTAQLRVTFDDQQRISGLGVAGLSYALASDEQEISFTSGTDTLYGTLLLPSGVPTPPVALLVAGSGPTDRNGNSPLLGVQVNTLASLARALADAGIASLRYDKLGAGKTGLGGHGGGTPPAFGDYLDEAQAAYAALLARPEVDPTRALVLGHSEGGLFAELLALQAPAPPDALILAAPASVPILDTLRRQLVEQADQALAAGQITQDEYSRLVADLDATVASIRKAGIVPSGVFAGVPSVQAVFQQPGIGAFLQLEDSYDPAQLAAQLPASLPVLVLHGDADRNVTEQELQHLLSGFQAAGNAAVQVAEFPNVDHELRQIPPGKPPALTVAYPFSPVVGDAVTGFADAVLA